MTKSEKFKILSQAKLGFLLAVRENGNGLVGNKKEMKSYSISIWKD